MKTRIYVRAARGKNGPKVAAGVTPNYHPLTETRSGNDRTLPTAMFALDVEIPDAVLRRAEHVAATVSLDAGDGQVIVAPLGEEATN